MWSWVPGNDKLCSFWVNGDIGQTDDLKVLSVSLLVMTKYDLICFFHKHFDFQFRHKSDNQVNNRQSEVLMDSK